MATSGAITKTTTTKVEPKPEQPPAPAPAPQPAPTFAQMQQAGVARPPAPSYNMAAAPQSTLGQQINDQFQQSGQPGQFAAPVPTMAPGANPWRPQPSPMQQSMMQQMMAYMGNPSGYTDDVAMNAFNRMRSQIDEDAKFARDRVSTDAARRGLYHSTPTLSRYGDIAVESDRAKNDALVRIQDEMAKARSGDMSRMLGLAMGYDQQQFGQGLAYDEFGASRDRDAYDRSLGTFNANEQARTRAFNERDQTLARLLGYGQQQFDNQMDTARFNDDRDAREMEMYMRLLGMG